MHTLLCAAVVAFGFLTSPVIALTPKVFLSAVGSDANSGATPFAPKRSLQGGHDAVDAGGEIVILDTAGYGPVVITKSVAVVVPQGVTGFVTVTATNAVGISVSAGAADTVSLRGLIVEGTGASGTGISASIGTLIVEDTLVRNFSTGIQFVSFLSGTRLVVRGGSIRNNGTGLSLSSGNPITSDALVTGTEFTKNGSALVANTNGMLGAAPRIVATRCEASGNNAVFSVIGSAAQIVADGCSIVANNTVYVVALTGNGTGSVFTSGNNRLANNTSIGPTPTLSPLQ